MNQVRKAILFFKSHVKQYVRKDGTVVGPFERSGRSESAKYGVHFKRGERVVDSSGNEHEVMEHVGPEVKTYGGKTFHPSKLSRPAKDWRDEENWHSRQMAKMKTHSEAELRFIIKDATEAAELAEERGSTEKAGKYRDEAHYAAMELHKRGQPLREAKAKHDAEKKER